jgi:formimidoylglutamate deiminase
VRGAESIGFDGGKLEPGAPADFFTVDLDDVSIAGASPEDLLANIVFSLARTAIRDVVVAGRQIVGHGLDG